jgi:hypothetical protein
VLLAEQDQAMAAGGVANHADLGVEAGRGLAGFSGRCGQRQHKHQAQGQQQFQSHRHSTVHGAASSPTLSHVQSEQNRRLE